MLDRLLVRRGDTPRPPNGILPGSPSTAMVLRHDSCVNFVRTNSWVCCIGFFLYFFSSSFVCLHFFFFLLVPRYTHRTSWLKSPGAVGYFSTYSSRWKHSLRLQTSPSSSLLPPPRLLLLLHFFTSLPERLLSNQSKQLHKQSYVCILILIPCTGAIRKHRKYKYQVKYINKCTSSCIFFSVSTFICIYGTQIIFIMRITNGS